MFDYHKLRMLRQARNLTQKKLAEFIGITRIAYRNIENGDSEPRPDTFYAICKVLQVAMEDLIVTREHQHIFFEIDEPDFPGCFLELSKGNVLVFYMDDGPGGISGQTIEVTCPHTVIHWFPDEESFWERVREKALSRSGRNARSRYVVIGKGGDAKTSLVVHDKRRETCG